MGMSGQRHTPAALPPGEDSALFVQETVSATGSDWRDSESLTTISVRTPKRLDRSESSYTECPRRNVPNFGRVFLMLNYTDRTQNTYVQI